MKLFYKSLPNYLIVFCLSIFLLSCGGGDDNEVGPNDDFIKFKVDGKEVSQANVKGQWDLKSRFYGDATYGYRFQIELSVTGGDSPKVWLEFHSKEKYVANKEYSSVTPTANSYSQSKFTVPTDDVIIKTNSFDVSNGVTLILTDIKEDRVKGRFTVNADKKTDAAKPSITDGEFSSKRRDL